MATVDGKTVRTPCQPGNITHLFLELLIAPSYPQAQVSIGKKLQWQRSPGLIKQKETIPFYLQSSNKQLMGSEKSLQTVLNNSIRFEINAMVKLQQADNIVSY